MATPISTDIIDGLLNKLDINELRFASLLAVSVITINDWRKQLTAELVKGKGSRLVRLSQVVDYLIGQTGNDPVKIREILEDGRVPLANAGDDDSLSLISYICAAPEDTGWKTNVVSAQEYMRYI